MLKRIVFVVIGFFILNSINAQIEGQAHEIGVSIGGGLSFELTYKRGTPKSLFRLRSVLFNLNNSRVPNSSTNKYTAGLFGGYERRANIAKYLKFVYGFDLGASYNGQTSEGNENNVEIENKEHVITPSINLVLGINYVLKDQWIFSLELLPYLSYGFRFTDRRIIQQGIEQIESSVSHFIHGGLNTKAVRLGVAYRFVGKKKKSKKVKG
ncbi:MAG: hypothetical protein GY810_17345 [Aureispira sp.]|nr:hypothetical protein [Aureispira sp.]